MPNTQNGRTACGLRLGQLNLGHGRAKSAGLGVYAAQERLDIVAVQEPYTVDGKIREIGTGVRLVSNGTSADPPCAGFAVFRQGLTVLNLSHLGDSHTVVIEVTTSAGPLYMVSMYCRFSHDLEPYTERLRVIMTALQGNRIILCLDSNAKSRAWGPSTDDRGRILEDLLLEIPVHVVNQPGSPATFVSHSGSTHIDVTLATHPRETRDWTVIATEGDSDHRLIRFFWSSLRERGEVPRVAGRYVERKADWELFRASLGESLPIGPNILDDTASIESVNEMANALTTTIARACDVSMPTSRGRSSGPVPWWTADIEAAREEVRRARRRFQRARDQEARALLREYYIRTKRALTRLIRKTKVNSWRAFVTRVGNDDPWGAVYQSVAKRRRTREVPTSLRLPDGTVTTTATQTLQYLLEALMPSDVHLGDGEHHRELRASAADEYRPTGPQPEVTPFTIPDVKAAVLAMGKAKAPGNDRITAGILSEALPVIASTLTYTRRPRYDEVGRQTYYV